MFPALYQDLAFSSASSEESIACRNADVAPSRSSVSIKDRPILYAAMSSKPSKVLPLLNEVAACSLFCSPK